MERKLQESSLSWPARPRAVSIHPQLPHGTAFPYRLSPWPVAPRWQGPSLFCSALLPRIQAQRSVLIQNLGSIKSVQPASEGSTQKWPETILSNCVILGEKLHLLCTCIFLKKEAIDVDQSISKGCGGSQTVQCEQRKADIQTHHAS